jgi:hypothetical protein
MQNILSCKSLAMAGLTIAALAAAPVGAKAKAQIGIYFGVPFYDGSPRDGYLFAPGYGWYAPEYRDRVRRNQGFGRVSCDEARRDLRRSGYRNVVAVDCRGREYRFEARRNGRNVDLFYNARTGRFGRL